MSNLILYKDSPQILTDFGNELINGLTLNLSARRGRYRYESTFANGSHIATHIRKYRSGHRRLNNTRALSRSIDFLVAGLKVYISFNEYGVMLDRGSDGIKLRQIDSRSELYDANINYENQEHFQKEIARWTARRGIRPRLKNKGVGLSLKNSRKNRKRMNFLITRSIANRGQNATFWFTNPYKYLTNKLPDNLIFGIHETMDDAFDKIFI